MIYTPSFIGALKLEYYLFVTIVTYILYFSISPTLKYANGKYDGIINKIEINITCMYVI